MKPRLMGIAGMEGTPPSGGLCFPVSTHPHKAGLCPIEAEEIKFATT